MANQKIQEVMSWMSQNIRNIFSFRDNLKLNESHAQSSSRYFSVAIGSGRIEFRGGAPDAPTEHRLHHPPEEASRDGIGELARPTEGRTIERQASFLAVTKQHSIETHRVRNNKLRLGSKRKVYQNLRHIGQRSGCGRGKRCGHLHRQFHCGSHRKRSKQRPPLQHQQSTVCDWCRKELPQSQDEHGRHLRQEEARRWVLAI